MQWPYALIFWAVFLWTFLPESFIIARRGERSITTQDAGSKLGIIVGQWIGMWVAFAAPFLWPSAALPFPVVCFWLGIAVLISGSLLRRHCWRMLGKSFTGAVVVHADQIIVVRDGRIIERGTHDSLLAQGGYYADLHQKQLLEEELARE